MMKVGGQVKKPGLNLSPKAKADLPPRSMNVKARMSAGGAGSPENLARGGRVGDTGPNKPSNPWDSFKRGGKVFK